MALERGQRFAFDFVLAFGTGSRFSLAVLIPCLWSMDIIMFT
jgi:hypothetical protein